MISTEEINSKITNLVNLYSSHNMSFLSRKNFSDVLISFCNSNDTQQAAINLLTENVLDKYGITLIPNNSYTSNSKKVSLTYKQFLDFSQHRYNNLGITYVYDFFDNISNLENDAILIFSWHFIKIRTLIRNNFLNYNDLFNRRFVTYRDYIFYFYKNHDYEGFEFALRYVFSIEDDSRIKKLFNSAILFIEYNLYLMEKSSKMRLPYKKSNKIRSLLGYLPQELLK